MAKLELPAPTIHALLSTTRLAMGAYAQTPAVSVLVTTEGYHVERSFNIKDTGTDFFIARNRFNTQELVVSIRGTEWNKWRDIITDLLIVPRLWRGGGKVAKGFLRAMESMLEHVLDFLSRSPNIQTVRVIGHSLGGAVATDLAPILAVKFPHLLIKLQTIGAPRAGDAVFAAWCNSLTNLIIDRFYHAGDPIVYVPMLAGLYVHLPGIRLPKTSKKCRFGIKRAHLGTTYLHTANELTENAQRKACI